MAIFNQGDVIKVPFPYTDRSTLRSRPALVVASSGLEEAHGLLWVVMITSAQNRRWPSDLPLNNLAAAGLPAPSVIRTTKITTIEVADATKLGRVSPTLFKLVAKRLGQRFSAGPAAG